MTRGSIDFLWDVYAWTTTQPIGSAVYTGRVLHASGCIRNHGPQPKPSPPGTANRPTTPNSVAFTRRRRRHTELGQRRHQRRPNLPPLQHLHRRQQLRARLHAGGQSIVSRSALRRAARAARGLWSSTIKTDATGGVSGTGYIEFGGSATINTIKSVGGTANGALYIYSEGTLRMLIGGSSGTRFHQTIYPHANQAIDIGLTGNRWRDVFCRSVDLTGDLILTTTTGTKIGTATTQKLGFFGATPVVQQAAVADATDAATAITQLNDLLAAMRTLGLIAT
jgi:hypothetical protein